MPKDQETQISKGFAFIEFGSPEVRLQFDLILQNTALA